MQEPQPNTTENDLIFPQLLQYIFVRTLYRNGRPEMKRDEKKRRRNDDNGKNGFSVKCIVFSRRCGW